MVDDIAVLVEKRVKERYGGLDTVYFLMQEKSKKKHLKAIYDILKWVSLRSTCF